MKLQRLITDICVSGIHCQCCCQEVKNQLQIYNHGRQIRDIRNPHVQFPMTETDLYPQRHACIIIFELFAYSLCDTCIQCD